MAKAFEQHNSYKRIHLQDLDSDWNKIKAQQGAGHDACCMKITYYTIVMEVMIKNKRSFSFM